MCRIKTSCDLCATYADYHLCQQHMNECVIGERDLTAERDEALEAGWGELEAKLQKYYSYWKWWENTAGVRSDACSMYRKRAEDAEKQVRELEAKLQNNKDNIDTVYALAVAAEKRAEALEAEREKWKENARISDYWRNRAEVAEAERDVYQRNASLYWDCWLEQAHRAEAAKKRVAELDEKLNRANKYINDWSDSAKACYEENVELEKRCAELEAQLNDVSAEFL